MADQVRERAELLHAMAEKWHDEETLGDSSCEYRELEIHAYIAGHAAATASHAAEVEELRLLIADDAYAFTFQTLGQYRTALLNAFDAALKGDKP